MGLDVLQGQTLHLFQLKTCICLCSQQDGLQHLATLKQRWLPAHHDQQHSVVCRQLFNKCRPVCMSMSQSQHHNTSTHHSA